MKAKIYFGFLLAVLVVSLASAGVGLKWSEESRVVVEGEECCLTYSVYNPWDQDSWVTISVSDNLKSIATSAIAETKFVSAKTSSSNAVPVKFCFKVGNVYEDDCWVAGKYLCKQTCSEDMKTYEGEVSVMETNAPLGSGNPGSATAAVISAPLRVKVRCVETPRDLTLLYACIAILSAVAITIVLAKKYSKKK